MDDTRAVSGSPRPAVIAALVFGSGLCALVYQTVWLKMFRLLFGASTAASAAVLAIFMAGLGFGGYLLSRRAERSLTPLALYGNLELGITLSACASPLLLDLARWVYYATGGSAGLGSGLSIAVRLALALLVLGVPTFLMGGTLPAVARAISASEDAGRRSLGLVYGANTLGAVAGALLGNLIIIEVLGLRGALYTAAALNAAVALIARRIPLTLTDTTTLPETTTLPASGEAAGSSGRAVPLVLVLVAAAVAGFAFLAMELVWYRMLGPILGGSSYSFGMILAVALLGIGLGSLLYSRGAAARRPTAGLLAVTFALEAVFMLIPYAMGDGVALLAQSLSPLARFSFTGSVIVWTVIATVVVLPASIVSGYQFPVLIALLGKGRGGVAIETGRTYLWNTVGAIAGSLGAGFGLIPALGALGLWRFSAAMLAVLAVVLLALAIKRDRDRGTQFAAFMLVLVGLFLALRPGPTAYSRHLPIGAGRFALPSTAIDVVAERHTVSRTIAWEMDGVESAVACRRDSSHAFIVNGKSDGNARMDACTQVMAGLVGPMLHPAPKTACVIGLGTGSTAGWMAAVDGMTRVDVAELEPAIIRVAEDCHHVNRNVLEMPNVKLHIGDGRELIMAHHGEPWDVIFSEPSNPYRAGIASLFSQDFYQVAAEKLSDDGLFVQWLQAYEIDPSTVESVYATMASVFPYIETWEGCPNDILLVGSKKPILHDVARVRARAAQEPYQSALARVWGVKGAEGFYSSFLAGDRLAREILAARPDEISTDDLPRLEFGFARGLGRNAFKLSGAVSLARRLGTDRPPVPDGSLDPVQLLEARAARMVASTALGEPAPSDNPGVQRARARSAWLDGRLLDARESWRRGGDLEPVQPLDFLVLGEAAAFTGDAAAVTRATELLRAAGRGAEAQFIEARLAATENRLDDAAARLVEGFLGARSDPWLVPVMVDRALLLSTQIAQTKENAAKLWDVLKEPFAAHLENDKRVMRRFAFASVLGFESHCVEGFEPMEPWVPFTPSYLADRVRCYRAHSHPLLEQALEDVETLVRLGTPEFGGGIREEAQ